MEAASSTSITVPLTQYVNAEYLPFVEDLIRMIVLQSVIQIMYFFKDPLRCTLFSFEFVELLLYAIVGVSVYWLVFKKAVKLV